MRESAGGWRVARGRGRRRRRWSRGGSGTVGLFFFRWMREVFRFVFGCEWRGGRLRREVERVRAWGGEKGRRERKTRSSFFFFFCSIVRMMRSSILRNASPFPGSNADLRDEPSPRDSRAGLTMPHHALQTPSAHLVGSHRVEGLFREPPSGADEQRRRDRRSARGRELPPAERAHIGREVGRGPKIGEGRGGSVGRRRGGGRRRRRRGTVAGPVGR